MKKLLLLGLAIAASLSSCYQEQRYTQQSPEIDTFKKVIDDYRKMNWEAMAKHYADTAKIANNVVKEKAVTVTKVIESYKNDAKLFTWEVEDTDSEMVITDKGETWVNYWGIWKGTLKSTGKVYVTPIHITVQFKDGKIVKEDGYWDNSQVVIDMLKTTPQVETATK